MHPIMITISIFILALNTISATSFISYSGSHNTKTDIKGINWLQYRVDTIKPRPPISNPALPPPPSLTLNRRTLHDGTCPADVVATLGRLLQHIERIARFAMAGAVIRTRAGRGRPRRDHFSEQAFQRRFSARPQDPSMNIPQHTRSMIRRKFLFVADQASRLFEQGREPRRAQDDQVYHCEAENEPDGICHFGGAVRVTHGGPGWNVICPPFHSIPDEPSRRVEFRRTKFAVLFETLLLGDYMTIHHDVALGMGDDHGVQSNADRYLNYLHDLYYHPDANRPPGIQAS